ncbi:MAG TPA: NAD(P)H-dependent oxidoreductase [Burkholderiales bacterium]|nr:NAD(P)H-dependent oxidoreductase [Burkholderiales bacterium]
MKTLLQIRSSIFSDAGQSSQLANRFVENWRRSTPGGKVVVRDLAVDLVPHLDAQRFGAFLAKPEDRTSEQASLVFHSDALIAELKAADVVVLGLPMYNFGIPSTLKAYFDHIARAGVTFKYTDKGPVGLLAEKEVYVFATRGGAYAGTPRDTQTGYVRNFLAFLGMTRVEFVYAEGLGISPESKDESIRRALAHVDGLPSRAPLPV